MESYMEHSSRKNNDDLLLEFCKDIDDWSISWQGVEADIKIGQDIVELFKPFLIKKINDGRTKKTIKMYANYLWALGGELIRTLHDGEDEMRLSARKLVLENVNEFGGPYWRHADSEADEDKYDSVCSQFYKFLISTT